MSNFSHIQTALENNAEVSVMGPFEEKAQIEDDQNWDKTLIFYVAPKKELYTGKDLQSFMTSLVPQMEPTVQEDFDQTNNHPFSGNVCFDEVIGTKTVHCEAVFTRENLFEDDEFVGISYKNQISCNRIAVWLHVWIYVLPNITMANMACKDKQKVKQTHFAEADLTLQRFHGQFF